MIQLGSTVFTMQHDKGINGMPLTPIAINKQGSSAIFVLGPTDRVR